MNNNFPTDDKTRVAGMPDLVATPGNAPQEQGGQSVPPVPKPTWPPQETPAAAEPVSQPAWTPPAPVQPPPQQPVWATQEPPAQLAPPVTPPSWQPQESAPPPPTPQPPSWSAQPVQPTAPPPPSWHPQAPPQPAAATPHPASPVAGPSQDLYRLSSQQDDMWFVVDMPGKPVRHPLRQGETVTVGREATQQIVIEEKTLSRNHLVLRRSGDRVSVQILGLNGLVFANQVHKSTTLEITAPASLTIGNVVCKIEKKFDTDATILMNDPAAQRHQSGGSGPAPATPSWNSPQQQPYAPLPPEGRHPFPDSQPMTSGYPPGQPPPGFSPPPGTPAYSYAQGSPGSGQDQGAREFPGGFAAREGESAHSGKKNRLLLMIGGGVVAAAAIVGGLLYYLNSAPPATVEPPPATATVQPPQPTISASGCSGGNQGANNLYAKYLGKASALLKEGNTKDACDYLKDIPQNSACWPEAIELAKRIEGCSLE